MAGDALDTSLVKEASDKQMVMADSIHLPLAIPVRPSPEQAAEREQAVQILKKAILGDSKRSLEGTLPSVSTSTFRGVTYVWVPIEAYGIGIWYIDDPVTICIAGTPTEKTFFSFARSSFRRVDGITILRTDKWGLNMFKLHFRGIIFYIQYHQSPIVNSWAQNIDKEISSLLETMSRQAEKRYLGYKRSAQLAQVFNRLFTRDCCYVAREWAKLRGLESPDFGLLSSNTLAVLVAIAVDRLPQQSQSAEAFQKSFFSLLLGGDWRHGKYESLALMPEDISPQVKDILKEETRIDLGSMALSEEVDSPLTVKKASFYKFSKTCQMFLRVNLSHFGSSSTTGGQFFLASERKLAGFVRRISKELHHTMMVRAWPYRLVETDSLPPSEGPIHETCYLIGLTMRKEESSGSTFDSFARRCYEAIDDDETFDERQVSIFTTLVSEFDADLYTLDQKTWPPVPEEADSEEEEEEEDSLEDAATKITVPSRVRKGKNPPPMSSQQATTSSSSGPLRPALDILHRIRHDASMDSSDYIVGYLDRFKGMKELALDKWEGGSEVSSEGFIPQSRIWYFLRKVDGVKVWDRETKTDLVFMSGNGSGNGNKEGCTGKGGKAQKG